MNALIANPRLMAQQGIRRLLILSGDAQWSRQQVMTLRQQMAGDWRWLGECAPTDFTVVSVTAAKTLLGQESLHAVFDATDGLNIEALAILAGTLRAGSWLILLVPTWADWPSLPDKDSLRWSEQPTPIVTDNFIHHLQQAFLSDPDVELWQQGQPLRSPEFPPRPVWLPPDGSPTVEQQQILQRLMRANSGIWVLTAARGRGKSTLAGMLVAQWPGLCWVTGPGKAATQVLNQRAGEQARFWAPDALLEYCQQHEVSNVECLVNVEWLLIDEAAAIPAPLLSALVAYFPRVLLTTTVQGYEGTGRGFLLKFCATLGDWQNLTLTNPIRWAVNDPLERVMNNALLFDDALFHDGLFHDKPPTETVSNPIQPATVVNIARYEQANWRADPALLRRFYGLLSSAHYRTTPLDLRRLMDAPGMHFSAASVDDSVVGALWGVDEGGLDESLAREVWAGRRRPKGSLVAQSLAAHSGQWRAPMLLSWRISRVAVSAAWRRQGIARKIIAAEQARAHQQQRDFLSVSFGYTVELADFWRRCGFRLVRIGSHKEASSGCYAAMALLPLSPAGETLCQAAAAQLSRDWYWLQPWIDITTPAELSLPEPPDFTLNDDDQHELAGFAFAFRPLEASLPALQRLLLQSALPLPALRGYLQEGLSPVDLVRSLGLTGRKALVALWRAEAAQGMASVKISSGYYLS